MRALKLQKQAARVGFDWDTAPPILEKISEEIGELAEVMEDADRERIAEEYGDVLFAMVNLGRHLDIEPEAALEAANLKFSNRFRYIERALEKAGRRPADASLDEMEALWQEAKKSG
jgi:ATP diphosphatase